MHPVVLTSQIWTDGRSKLLQELLGSMQIIKVFTYELPFLKRELTKPLTSNSQASRSSAARRWSPSARSSSSAPPTKHWHSVFLPSPLSSPLSHTPQRTQASTRWVPALRQDRPTDRQALIFTSLAYFNLLRQPLMFLPRALSSLTDAQTAVERLSDLFDAEQSQSSHNIDPRLPVAIRADDASFQWATAKQDVAPQTGAGRGGGKGGKPGGKKKDKKGGKDDNKTEEKSDKPTEEPFSINHLNLEVPRGHLAAIVGPVGSGKSSILQGVSSTVLHLSSHPAPRRDAQPGRFSQIWRSARVLPAVSVDPERVAAGQHCVRPEVG